ncbi:hypothetical protein ACLOJK_014231 [Asimina triloba]
MYTQTDPRNHAIAAALFAQKSGFLLLSCTSTIVRRKLGEKQKESEGKPSLYSPERKQMALLLYYFSVSLSLSVNAITYPCTLLSDHFYSPLCMCFCLVINEFFENSNTVKELNGPNYYATIITVLHAGTYTNKNAYKALIAAEYVGIKIELAQNFEMGVSNQTPEFLTMNPIGKVPVLETPEGPIFESNAIARYVARLKGDNLYGSSLFEYKYKEKKKNLHKVFIDLEKMNLLDIYKKKYLDARIEQWIDFASMEIDANLLRWIIPRLGRAVYFPPAEEAAIAALKRALAALNTHLALNTYLVGHSVTLADIVMTCNLLLGFNRLMIKSFTSEFPHVERYFWTMVNQPNFYKILGEVKQAESVPPVQSVKKSTAPKESAKPKAKEEPKKEAKKEVKKEPVKPKAEDAEDEEEAPKPKPKNPLDLLPPSKMILDDWKRLYSNTKTNFREVAIKGFWDMYDPEGYSLWFCDYKYNDENTVSFVTLNKVSGFLQRMDLARKYAFGKMLVIGAEPPYKVKGLWLFRGLEIPQFVLDECYDMELYEWKKVDISDEAQKERANAMIEDQEPFEGEALLDAKCFK